MKQVFALIFAFFITIKFLCAQISNPAHWKFEAKKINDTEFDLIATVKLDSGWYIYSQFIKGDGPIPTAFVFKSNIQYVFIGKMEEASENRISEFDKIFDMQTTRFKNEVKFTQRIKLKKEFANISGTVTFFTRTDEKAIPPNEEDFHYRLKISPVFKRN